MPSSPKPLRSSSSYNYKCMALSIPTTCCLSAPSPHVSYLSPPLDGLHQLMELSCLGYVDVIGQRQLEQLIYTCGISICMLSPSSKLSWQTWYLRKSFFWGLLHTVLIYFKLFHLVSVILSGCFYSRCSFISFHTPVMGIPSGSPPAVVAQSKALPKTQYRSSACAPLMSYWLAHSAHPPLIHGACLILQI